MNEKGAVKDNDEFIEGIQSATHELTLGVGK